MTLRQILKDACSYYNWQYRDYYSGRGMSGTSCPAIITERDEVTFGMDMVEYCQDHCPGKTKAVISLLRTTHTDSMGHDTVYYWPDLEN